MSFFGRAGRFIVQFFDRFGSFYIDSLFHNRSKVPFFGLVSPFSSFHCIILRPCWRICILISFFILDIAFHFSAVSDHFVYTPFSFFGRAGAFISIIFLQIYTKCDFSAVSDKFPVSFYIILCHSSAVLAHFLSISSFYIDFVRISRPCWTILAVLGWRPELVRKPSCLFLTYPQKGRAFPLLFSIPQKTPSFCQILPSSRNPGI